MRSSSIVALATYLPQERASAWQNGWWIRESTRPWRWKAWRGRDRAALADPAICRGPPHSFAGIRRAMGRVSASSRLIFFHGATLAAAAASTASDISATVGTLLTKTALPSSAMIGVAWKN